MPKKLKPTVHAKNQNVTKNIAHAINKAANAIHHAFVLIASTKTLSQEK